VQEAIHKCVSHGGPGFSWLGPRNPHGAVKIWIKKKGVSQKVYTRRGWHTYLMTHLFNREKKEKDPFMKALQRHRQGDHYDDSDDEPYRDEAMEKLLIKDVPRIN